VIPMHLGGLWQSFFSRYRPKKLFRRVWSRVRLDIGAILPATVTAAELETHVRALATGGALAPDAPPLAPARAD